MASYRREDAPGRLRRRRTAWRYAGTMRPPFAIDPGPEQESVWDYPRPPRLAPDGREVIVRKGPHEIARTCRAIRVLETASPPAFYLPPDEVRRDMLVPAGGESLCEWKGAASYWSVTLPGRRLNRVAWSYPHPLDGFEAIRDFVAFYPAALECYVDGVRVEPQPGGFYGGWVTPDVVGPFKGEPGTESW
jgi:uncharacterized protein (DUF427 family)